MPWPSAVGRATVRSSLGPAVIIRAPRTPEYPSGLSQREVEVLRLIAAGKTDRKIAEELFISFRTVGNHVRNILKKTNAASRAEATGYAVREGLA